jgi:hypothetical protein
MSVVIADRRVARIRSLVAGPTIRLFFADASRAGSALLQPRQWRRWPRQWRRTRWPHG